MTSTVSWRRVIVATLVAGVLMQAATALLWMNPLTTRLILTPEFGQSQKLINVWRVWEPLPRITEQPSVPMMVGFLLFTLFHVLLYLRFAPLLPGNGWVGKGLSLALGIWIFQYGYFEFFTPFNQYREPLFLIAYELVLQGIMALVEGLAIARLLR
ncbi:MAG: hypothetical protein HY725_09080 [Candidatus Rokubacteria bacterium]|nr:hypothetical protein [Candidatus Rokubacteria bacterium]